LTARLSLASHQAAKPRLTSGGKAAATIKMTFCAKLPGSYVAVEADDLSEHDRAE
jgi:hypothetical protein